MCRVMPKSETWLEAQLHPQCARLSLSGSSFPHLLNGNNNSYHLGQRKWSKALAPASGHSTVLWSLSAHSCAHPMSWSDPSSAT